MQNTIRQLGGLLILFAVMTGTARAQQPGDPKKDPSDPQNHDPSGPVMIQVVGGPGGAGNAMFMPGPGGPGGFGRDALQPVILVLGECNLAPDFNLNAEQKQKIEAVRDDFKQVTEMWRKDHAEELKQLDEQQQEMMQNLHNGNVDPQQMMELAEQRRLLMETAPSGEEHAEQVKQLLTPEQLKQFEEKEAAMEAERQEMFGRPGDRMRFRIGGPGGPGPAPADKDKPDKGR